MSELVIIFQKKYLEPNVDLTLVTGDDNEDNDEKNHLAVENFHTKSHWLFLEDSLKIFPK